MSGTRLAVRTVVITGASRGVGRAIAVALAEARRSGPLHLALLGRDVAALEETSRAALAADRGAVRPEHDRVEALEVECLSTDVTDSAQVKAAFAAVKQRWETPDSVVLNAGVADSSPFHATSDEQFDRLLKVNLHGVFYGLREGLAGMRELGRGRAVAIGSIASKLGAPYISAYCASKHGVLGLVRAAAREYGHLGITVNLVCPGYVDTPMTEKSLANIHRRTQLPREEALARILANNPQRRLLAPEEVAGTVVYLLGFAASGVNGAAIDIDGGELAG